MEKVSDYIFRFLEERGVSHCFMLPGGGCMHMLDSLGRSKIQGVSLLHEQGAAIAAESYAFTSGKVGCLLVTTGPGGTNAVTGVLSAYLDSIPCIILSGQVKTADLKERFGVRSHGSQEADIINMVKGITKYSVMIRDKDTIRYHLERAWHEATTGRKGPVWLDIPLDIQGGMVDADKLTGFSAPVICRPDVRLAAEQIVALLEGSQQPVMIAGNGLRGAEAELEKFLQRWAIPIIPTWKAADLIPNDHPLYAGRCGTLGERAANFAMQTADLVISFGSRLDFSITGFDRHNWCPGAKKVIVEIDPTELYKMQIPIELPIVCDASSVLQALNQTAHPGKQYLQWRERIGGWRRRYPILPGEPGESGLPTTYQLVDEVCSQMPEDAILVPASAGTVAEICYQALYIRGSQKVRSNHGLGAMGYEIPASIGAAIASGKTVVTVAGDGGIQLNIQELAIVAGRKLPIKIFLANNGGYSSIRSMQRNHFKGRYVGSNRETGLFLPDMVSLAGAYGIAANRVTCPEALHAGVKQAFTTEGPFLCDIRIDPFCVVSPRATSKAMPDGSMVSTPLEDLFPFLPEERLREELDLDY